jgi:hypothetical protein
MNKIYIKKSVITTEQVWIRGEGTELGDWQRENYQLYRAGRLCML